MVEHPLIYNFGSRKKTEEIGLCFSCRYSLPPSCASFYNFAPAPVTRINGVTVSIGSDDLAAFALINRFETCVRLKYVVRRAAAIAFKYVVYVRHRFRWCEMVSRFCVQKKGLKW